MRRILSLRLLRWVAVAGLLLAWLGIVFRGRDGWVVAAMIYYATPWLLRVVAGLLAVIVLRHRGLRLMAATCLLVSSVEGWRSFRFDVMPMAGDAELQVSIYNAGRTLEGDPEAWFSLGNADLTAVVESGDFSEEKWQAFATATKGLNWQRFGGTMLGVKGKILSHETLGVHDRYRCYRARVELGEHGEMTVIVADVRSQPWMSRDQAMAGILRAAAKDPKVVVLGDFNTPPGSKWYRDWHDTLLLANDGPRLGFRETWAFGLPLLTLDQVWVGSGWRPIWTDQTQHASDHARVRSILVGRKS
jgi:endonuclease/exonuclease/phosphatase family metal-dependent hydrolase